MTPNVGRRPRAVAIGSLITGWWVPELLHRLFDRERAGSLPRWKLNKACEMLRDDTLRRNDHERMLDEPSNVVARLMLRTLERI
jgi:hypothetical protein